MSVQEKRKKKRRGAEEFPFNSYSRFYNDAEGQTNEKILGKIFPYQIMNVKTFRAEREREREREREI